MENQLLQEQSNLKIDHSFILFGGSHKKPQWGICYFSRYFPHHLSLELIGTGGEYREGTAHSTKKTLASNWKALVKKAGQQR